MKNKLIIDYIKALTNLYGIVTKENLIEIYNLQNGDKITIEEMDNIATQDILEASYIIGLDDVYMQDYLEEDYSVSTLLKQQMDKPYYVPKKVELVKYADQFYFEKTKQYKNLRNYIKNHLEEDEKIIEGLCEDIHISLDDNLSAEHIIFEFQRKGIDFKDEKQLTEVMNLVTELANNTRMKENRGYTPTEIMNMFGGLESKSKIKNKKIGRNDPCPCGSGKKYKKCCIDK